MRAGGGGWFYGISMAGKNLLREAKAQVLVIFLELFQPKLAILDRRETGCSLEVGHRPVGVTRAIFLAIFMGEP